MLGTADLPDAVAPVRARMAETQRAISETERRLRNQVLALEDEQITEAARRRISDRIAELEQEITAHQASPGKLQAELNATPPDAPSVAALLGRLPVFGERLREFTQGELRRLFDSLDLMITYDPNRHAAQVRITLAANDGSLGRLVHPTCHNPNTPPPATPLVSGPVIRLPRQHAKVRRDGCRAS